jgi:hypothetical protein
MSDTNLKHWNEQLSEYIHTNNTILNIRPNKGETTSWFLNNLCVNSKSLVYAIDTWEENEHKFDNNIIQLFYIIILYHFDNIIQFGTP